MKKCSKFGTLSDSKFCPECGAALGENEKVEITPNENDTQMDKETNEGNEKKTVDNIPQGNTRATYQQVNQETYTAIPVEPVKEKFYKKTWFIILMLIIFFPVGLFLMWKFSKWNKVAKIIITIIIGLLFIIGLIPTDNTEDTINNNTNSSYTEAYDNEESEAYDDEDYEYEEESNYGVFTTESDYKSVSYDNLARTPDNYKYSKIKGTGEVIQVLESDGETQLRIAINGDYDKVVLVYYDSNIVSSRVLEGDSVTYYGTSYGLYTYESTMGGEITVPLIEVHKIVRQ